MNADEARGFAAGVDMQALAEAVHNGRFNGPVTTPYCEEIEAGRLYCMRIANSVALHLAALAPQPQPSAEDVARLVEALRAIFAKLDRPYGAPGHCHSVKGIWDADNKPDIAGKPCEWCAQWEAARVALAAFSGEKL